MKIIIFIFQGGLGNQMFQWAMMKALKQKYPKALIFADIHYSEGCHSGFELFRIFNLPGKFTHITTKILTSKFRKYIYKASAIIQESNAYQFNPTYLRAPKGLSWYEGYWQSEKYFINIADYIKNSFKFKYSLLNPKSEEYLKNIMSSNSVSVHIRRGDYLSITTNGKSIVLPIKFYDLAIKEMNKRVEAAIYFVFSDDIDWCKAKLNIPSAIYIDCNNSTDSWQDMCLMSACKHNIVANSTFSWWGAWLNSNPEKTVIIPDWGGDTDFVPFGWIQIKY